MSETFIKIWLSEGEYQELVTIAERECRDVSQQARKIVKDYLEKAREPEKKNVDSTPKREDENGFWSEFNKAMRRRWENPKLDVPIPSDCELDYGQGGETNVESNA